MLSRKWVAGDLAELEHTAPMLRLEIISWQVCRQQRLHVGEPDQWICLPSRYQRPETWV